MQCLCPCSHAAGATALVLLLKPYIYAFVLARRLVVYDSVCRVLKAHAGLITCGGSVCRCML